MSEPQQFTSKEDAETDFDCYWPGYPCRCSEGEKCLRCSHPGNPQNKPDEPVDFSTITRKVCGQ